MYSHAAVPAQLLEHASKICNTCARKETDGHFIAFNDWLRILRILLYEECAKLRIYECRDIYFCLNSRHSEVDQIFMGSMRSVQNYIFMNVVIYTSALTLGIGKIYFIFHEWLKKCTDMRILVVLVNFVVPVDQFPFHGSQISHVSVSVAHYYTWLSHAI
jgi:hypothetical protein